MTTMKPGWRALLISVAFLALTACQPGDEGAAEWVEQPAPSTTAPAPGLATPASAPQDLVLDSPGDELVERESGINTTGDLQRISVGVGWQAAITGGRRITVTFPGNEPGNFESACYWDYWLDVEESRGAVRIGLTSTRILAPGADKRLDCERSEVPWAITTSLDAPLGARPLTDLYAGRTHRPVQIETRLTPTWLPADWVTLVYDETLPQQLSSFGLSEEPNAPKIEVLTSPISITPRLSDLRAVPGWESIDVRRPDDGVLLVDDDRTTTVGFEEQGWFYQIVARPEVDPSVVLEFARSFERPALIDPGARSDALVQPLTTVPLQRGQDEGEARPLQGVLPTE